MDAPDAKTLDERAAKLMHATAIANGFTHPPSWDRVTETCREIYRRVIQLGGDQENESSHFRS